MEEGRRGVGVKVMCFSVAVSFQVTLADICEFSVNLFLCTAANTAAHQRLKHTKDLGKCSALAFSIRMSALEYPKYFCISL